ncbi:Similar to tax-6: Serine/threonine-protein phosphatase 2B catalytic subunit (Caenorhabditis elegans) [Cotesia congregata]|uniref:Similar to tax-6: Serine/threonine-protein phosphatase 2B catalytic subunit (Caenorhabditis elegans) n=1 Tax=Cotesia congregata TaxID=51543 RepID=A0A8J2E2M5_COTCN|nr:Similar to tax-6: Serine/threonine-protein phosphatase 2B catalytic subunit (Caenorhabditis elegans) [Cotesia congregata]
MLLDRTEGLVTWSFNSSYYFCVLYLWALKLCYPTKLFPLCGNHKCRLDISLNFSHLSKNAIIAALVNNQFLCVHNSLSSQILVLEDIQKTDLESHQLMVRCVTYFGQIHSKTFVMKSIRKTLQIIAFGVVRFSTVTDIPVRVLNICTDDELISDGDASLEKANNFFFLSDYFFLFWRGPKFTQESYQKEDQGGCKNDTSISRPQRREPDCLGVERTNAHGFPSIGSTIR